MSKPLNIFFRITLTITVIVPVAILPGCASKGQGTDVFSPYASISKPEFKNPPPKELKPDPSDSALLKELPEMTFEEYERSGDISLSKGDNYTAFVQYEKALELNPGNIRVIYKKGELFISSGKYEDAVKEIQKVIAKDPKNASAYEKLGEAFFMMKNYSDAEKNLLAAVELDPKLWRSRCFLGNIYDYQKKYDMASRQYLEAIDLKPDKGLLYNNLGMSYYLAGRYDDAIYNFKKALGRNSPKEKTYNNLGLALAMKGQYNAALSAFKNGTDEARASNNMGVFYLAQGNLKEAKRYFNRAIAASPKFYEKANENLEKAEIELAK